MNTTNAPPLDQRLSGDLEALAEFGREFSRIGSRLPQRINAEQTNVEQGLAKLVLTVIELIRRLLEKQALRRIDTGALTEEQIERMGETFLKLDQKIAELQAVFGLEDEDLNLDLGPLGNLM